VALCALAFARPVLDTFGRSPESFVARAAGPGVIVAFALVVFLVPPLALAVAGLATRAFGPRVRVVAHVVLVLVAGAVAGRRLIRDVTGGDWPPPVVITLGVLAGAGVAALRWRTAVAASFLRVAGVASVVYLVQFLVLSPTAELVVGDGAPGVDHEVAASVSAALGDRGDDPPDVVVLVFDALPTQTLLDGEGRIDAELFPNFAALAGTSSWYRNATTVSMFTRDAVPAILTGRFPDPTNEPDDVPADDPENLFTLLGASYDLHAREQITQLCPDDLCPRPASEGLGRLLHDAVGWWRGPGVEDDAEDDFSLPALLDDDRFDEAEAWARELPDRPAEAAAARADGPDLHFYHAALPHDPWQFLPDGTVYDTERYPVGYFRTGWYGPGIDVGRQRHVLQAQAADHLLGEVLDRLQASGAFDDTLVVVTADHGHAFVPGTAWRWLSQRNYEELMWAPLLVKQPGQAEAEVVDENVMSIDVVPTIAETLGIDLPWKVDGRPVGESAERDQDVKYVDDDEDNVWRSEPGESLVRVTGAQASFRRVIAADPVEATGPGAVWRRTPHGALVGRSVRRLDVGEAWPGDAEVDVDGLDALRGVDLDDPLPLEAIGRSDLEAGTYVAYALNGTVATVAEVEEDSRAGDNLVLGLLRPDDFVAGDNSLSAYVVDGGPGDEVLRPVRLAGAT
jgi:Sulfatase